MRLFHVEHRPEGPVTLRSFSAMLEAELEALAAINRRRACPEVAGRSRVHPRSGRQVHALVLLERLPRTCFPPCPRNRGRRGCGARRIRRLGFPARRGDLPAHRTLEAALAAFLDRPAASPSRPATRQTSAS